ncbi:MAG TPA: anthranilate synthase component I [Thermomicrobiales bacterium]|nr:anthranilate synthase component I [Thermomicrobiales bacterium]
MTMGRSTIELAAARDVRPSLEDVQAMIGGLDPSIRTVPIYREILADLETPVSVYLKVTNGATEPGFVLESVEGGIRIARYSFIGMDILASVTMDGARCRTETGADSRVIPYTDPLAALQGVLDGYRAAPAPGLPRFTGGAVGYLTYDAIAKFEPRVGLADGPGLGLPEARFHLADTLVVFDHLERTMKIVAHVSIDADAPIENAYAAAVDRIDKLTDKLDGTTPPYAMSPQQHRKPVEARRRPNTSRDRYRQMVERSKHYITEGDIFQVVPSQRVDIATQAHPFTLYRALRMVNPSPYMFFLDFGDHQIVGASPELLTRLEEGVVTNHPIAGTRPRGATNAEDAQNAIDLLADEKELAEHIMLVDLGRNDVGRVSRPGSVRVPKLMEIERFSHVMHIVSHVEGDLQDGLTGFDALRSCFPAGTVSGAPKIRAMEIIAELESDRRGVYSGAVGYFDFAGGMDTAIALRTMVVRDGVASLQAGGGVVADSDPDTEYEESLHKMRALVRAIERAEEIEASEMRSMGRNGQG